MRYGSIPVVRKTGGAYTSEIMMFPWHCVSSLHKKVEAWILQVFMTQSLMSTMIRIGLWHKGSSQMDSISKELIAVVWIMLSTGKYCWSEVSKIVTLQYYLFHLSLSYFRAITTFYDARDWFNSLCKRVMEQDWSWNRPALDYMELYHSARKNWT